MRRAAVFNRLRSTRTPRLTPEEGLRGRDQGPRLPGLGRRPGRSRAKVTGARGLASAGDEPGVWPISSPTAASHAQTLGAAAMMVTAFNDQYEASASWRRRARRNAPPCREGDLVQRQRSRGRESRSTISGPRRSRPAPTATTASGRTRRDPEGLAGRRRRRTPPSDGRSDPGTPPRRSGSRSPPRRRPPSTGRSSRRRPGRRTPGSARSRRARSCCRACSSRRERGEGLVAAEPDDEPHRLPMRPRSPPSARPPAGR